MNTQEIIEASRKKYARPKAIVEQEISEWASTTTLPTKVSSTCDVCGKETILNFEPTPGKPIYCLDCLKKVKEGKIAAIPEERHFKKMQEKFRTNLADIGIEIEEEHERKEARGNERHDERRNERRDERPHRKETRSPETSIPSSAPQKKSVIDTLEEKFSKITEKKEEFTLKDLKGHDSKQKEKSPTKNPENIDDLRASLREALTKRQEE